MRSALPMALACSALCLIHGPLAAQAPGWPGAVAAFDSLLQCDSIVGGSLVLFRDGRVLVRHDAGLADRATGRRVTDRTIFHWGSITKTLTAAAIMQLRDRGLLSLDDPITRWIPELRQVHNPYGSMDAITLRMLLSHSSGFQGPTWPYRKYVDWEPFEPTRWDQLLAMMPYQEIQFPPGSRFGYSNPAYIYLARVIEAITGDAWQSYIYKNVWGPLGIQGSYFNLTPWHLESWRSHNYTVVRDSASGREQVKDNGADFDPGITIPNGGWNAPVADLGLWLQFLTGASAGDASRARLDEIVLRRRTLEEMWRPVVPVGEGPDSVGLGFFLTRAGGARVVGHTGEQAGFRSFMYFNPATRAAVAGVVNTTDDARSDESAKAFTRAARAAIELLR